jgi:hypothetical protein
MPRPLWEVAIAFFQLMKIWHAMCRGDRHHNNQKGSLTVSDTTMDPSFYKPILSISIPPSQRDAFYRALMTLRERDGRPFVSLSALVVKAVITAAAVDNMPPAPDVVESEQQAPNGTVKHESR